MEGRRHTKTKKNTQTKHSLRKQFLDSLHKLFPFFPLQLAEDKQKEFAQTVSVTTCIWVGVCWVVPKGPRRTQNATRSAFTTCR